MQAKPKIRMKKVQCAVLDMGANPRAIGCDRGTFATGGWRDKSESSDAADQERRLVIEWTVSL
jgi:hypothetical protein